ncbi:MAG: glycosyltransferase family 4 protein [Vicinamibacterales bacterium]
MTDAWVPPGSVWAGMPGALPRRLSERFHADLADASVTDFTVRLLAREAAWRLQGTSGWNLLMARNRWFGRRAANALRRLSRASDQTVVFAHSYSARQVLAEAKARGWTTVLGQIDPGPEHFRIAAQCAKEWPEYGPAPEAPPAAYFESWRAECESANWIVVNSEWARDALQRAGIAPSKLRVIPLAYEPELGGAHPDRQYPTAFTRARPMRLLFVGHVAVAKGMPAVLEAVAQLTELPIELRVVGAMAMDIPRRFIDHPGIRWVGPVPRLEVMRHYRESDLLVFPSYSDGFGMAQVEAQGWRLPILASRHCGRVVADGITGLLLPEVTPAAIAAALRRLAAAPELLASFARASAGPRPPGLAALTEALLGLETP